jgi:hypothetical protein
LLAEEEEKGRRGNLGEEETGVVQNEEIRRRGAGESQAGGGGPRGHAPRVVEEDDSRGGDLFSDAKGYVRSRARPKEGGGLKGERGRWAGG